MVLVPRACKIIQGATPVAGHPSKAAKLKSYECVHSENLSRRTGGKITTLWTMANLYVGAGEGDRKRDNRAIQAVYRT